MNYITPEQVLFIRYRVIAETGGSHGIRDLTLLQSALARPIATFDKNDLYQDIFSKTAALMHSIIKNHSFVDGNKRTAITTAQAFFSGMVIVLRHLMKNSNDLPSQWQQKMLNYTRLQSGLKGIPQR